MYDRKSTSGSVKSVFTIQNKWNPNPNDDMSDIFVRYAIDSQIVDPFGIPQLLAVPILSTKTMIKATIPPIDNNRKNQE